jgi:hypothetical protein
MMVKPIQLTNMTVLYETQTIKVVKNEDGTITAIKK